jgi:inositol transport system ATP-binding protein
MLREAKKMLEGCGVNLNPNIKMNKLSVAEKQLIEIVKAIFYNSQIVVMDEPTSAITEKEVENLFGIIRKLIQDGKSVIYITHKMDEIFKICDNATVLRDGRLIGSKPIEELDKQQIISMMVGRDLQNNLFTKLDAEIGEVALEVKNLTFKGKFENISFHVKKGEILGVAGLMGAGRSEVMETIFGLRKADSGEIFIHGKKVNIKSPKDAIKNKVAFITEDRKLLGLNLVASVKDNISLVNLSNCCVCGNVIDLKKVRDTVDSQITVLRIKTPSREQIVNNLSGGNQQKVVLAKWLLCEPDILILDEPTRGIDVGAKAEIYRLISTMAQEGKTIIMISSELPEIIGMSDRVIVLHEGQLTGELSRSELDQEKIMTYAAGANLEG